MRLAYLGTPEAAVPPLRALVDAGHDVRIVVTRPDKRRGRGATLLPSPVKAAAVDLGLPVTEKVDDVLTAGVALGVVVAFGRIIKPHVLEQVPMVNVHFSLLPRWRGAAPVERAILAGDTETGVCIMEVAEELDAGGVYAVERTPIGEHETAGELRTRLVEIGTRLLVRTIAALPAPEPQRGEPVYAAKLDPAELHIDWSKPAEEIERLTRVGGAWTTHKGKRLKVLEACAHVDGAVSVVAGDGRPLALQRVQPEGKGPMDAAAWARGSRWQAGDHLGD